MLVIMKLKVKGCDRVFKDGLGPGVLMVQEVETTTEEEPWLSLSLMRCEREMIAKYIEVEMVELKEGQ